MKTFGKWALLALFIAGVVTLLAVLGNPQDVVADKARSLAGR